MPEKSAVVLATSNEHPGALVAADAHYFQKCAEQCRRLAERARDPGAAITLRSLATAFEVKANALTSSGGRS
jgi:orotidine-5'-phosphate decarboxylase